MSFDALAPHYTWMEKVLAGSRLQRCRVMWLEALADHERILVAGVGHGHFLQRCAQRFPAAKIMSVDASAGMLRRAEQRAIRSSVGAERLEFVQARLPEWKPPSQTFDAIVTHFFLDCFPPDELRTVIEVLAAAARYNATWLWADFAIPPRGLARHRARAIHALMYAFFRRATRLRARRLTDPRPFLSAVGFNPVGRRSSEWGLLQSEHWSRGNAAA